MPFSGPSSWLSTTDEFIAHWTDVNAALAPNPLVLLGPYALADLQSDRDDLATAMTELVDALVLMDGLRTTRDNSKEAIRERMRQLSFTVRGILSGTADEGTIPELIRPGQNSGLWINAMDRFEEIWTNVNTDPPAGFTPPLLLTGAYALASFTIDINALKATFTAISDANVTLDREKEERDAIYFVIRDHLVNYREAVQGAFPEGHPLILSLPRLTPLPGHTPDPVELAGEWNPTEEIADFNWSASTDPDLLQYSLRRSGATPYDTSTEIVVLTFPPGTLSGSTKDGLQLPGSSMGFKLYVELTTGNEKGSNTVTIDHP